MKFILLLKSAIDTFFRIGRNVALVLAGLRGLIHIVEQIVGKGMVTAIVAEDLVQ